MGFTGDGCWIAGASPAVASEGECVFLARDADEVDDPPDGSPYSEVDGFLFTSEPVPADRLRFLRQHT